MAFLVIEIDSANLQVADFNAKMNSTNARQGVNKLMNILSGVLTGSASANVQVTSRTTTASVSTSGTGSTQVTYTLK